MQENELNVTQVNKGIAITVSFVVLRLIAAKLWNLWFGMRYALARDSRERAGGEQGGR